MEYACQIGSLYLLWFQVIATVKVDNRQNKNNMPPIIRSGHKKAAFSKSASPSSESNSRSLRNVSPNSQEKIHGLSTKFSSIWYNTDRAVNGPRSWQIMDMHVFLALCMMNHPNPILCNLGVNSGQDASFGHAIKVTCSIKTITQTRVNRQTITDRLIPLYP